MRKQYDDFTQLKLKDMSKSISDMTYKYINPETQVPTVVPAQHYEKILDQVTEKYMADITSRKFLVIMFEQLNALKKEDEKYFNQALLCMDLGLNPKDLRINEQIAIEYTNSFIEDKKNYEKKIFHFLSEDIVNTFEKSKNDPNIQTTTIKLNNVFEEKDDSFIKPRINDMERLVYMEVKINKEIRNYTESIFFGLSLRQFICTVLGCALAVLLYFLFKPLLGLELTSWVCMLGALPFILLGFVKYNGMPLEKLLIAFIKSEILTPKNYILKQ